MSKSKLSGAIRGSISANISITQVLLGKSSENIIKEQKEKVDTSQQLLKKSRPVGTKKLKKN